MNVKKSSLVKWGVMAVCFVVAVVSLLPNYLKQRGVMLSNDLNGVIVDNLNSADMLPVTSEILISMSDIILNQVDGFASSDYARYNPETDDKVVWNKKDIAAYYGTDLTPAYIPDGLAASAQNGNSIVYIGQDGIATEDTIQLGFYQAEDMTVRQGFSITASKMGIVQTCLYLLPEEVKTTRIGGTEVIFGYRSMPYPPYNAVTNEPAGSYDMYVAEFEHNGIEYQMIAEQMEVEEVVKVVASIITGKKDIVFDNPDE